MELVRWRCLKSALPRTGRAMTTLTRARAEPQKKPVALGHGFLW